MTASAACSSKSLSTCRKLRSNIHSWSRYSSPYNRWWGAATGCLAFDAERSRRSSTGFIRWTPSFGNDDTTHSRLCWQEKRTVPAHRFHSMAADNIARSERKITDCFLSKSNCHSQCHKKYNPEHSPHYSERIMQCNELITVHYLMFINFFLNIYQSEFEGYISWNLASVLTVMTDNIIFLISMYMFTCCNDK